MPSGNNGQKDKNVKIALDFKKRYDAINKNNTNYKAETT